MHDGGSPLLLEVVSHKLTKFQMWKLNLFVSDMLVLTTRKDNFFKTKNRKKQQLVKQKKQEQQKKTYRQVQRPLTEDILKSSSFTFKQPNLRKTMDKNITNK